MGLQQTWATWGAHAKGFMLWLGGRERGREEGRKEGRNKRTSHLAALTDEVGILDLKVRTVKNQGIVLVVMEICTDLLNLFRHRCSVFQMTFCVI